MKKIWLDYLKMQSEMNARLMTMQAPNQQAAQMINLFEKTKVLDIIYINTGLKMGHLTKAHEQFALDQDEDIKTYINAIQMQNKKAQEEAEKQTNIPDENIPVIEKALAEVGLTSMMPDIQGMVTA